MKVLLLEHPRSVAADRCNDIANTPLSSCLLSGYAAAALTRDGHNVEIVEGFLDSLSYDEIRNRVSAFRPDILAVHMVYSWERNVALFAFLDEIKAGLSPFIIAFGFYPTIAYREILADSSAIDSIVAGEPELAMSRLASTLPARVDTFGIPGLVFRDGAGDFRVNEPEVIEDLDTMAFPLRTEALSRLEEINLLGSRGCYGRCTFCYVNRFFAGTSWRRRSPENIASEIDEIVRQTGKRSFYFTDPNFFGPGRAGQERALRIAALLKERNLAFGIEGRVNDIHDETIEALVGAGLRHILIGLESGSDARLKRLNKLTTVAQNEEALRVLRRHGVEPNVGFIMFEPDSTLEDVRTNFEFLRRNELLGELSRTANVLYHHQIILEGTAAYRELKAKGRLVVGPSDYEGTTYFEEPRVAALASIMRRVTNSLFSALDPIWSGQVAEPEGAKEGYERMNRLLVTIFDENLRLLEQGKRLGEDDLERIVRGAERQIKETVERLGASEKVKGQRSK